MSDLSRRQFLLRAGVAAAAATTGPYLLRQPLARAVVPTARRLAFGADPATSMSVTWSTAETVSPAVRVLLGAEEVALVPAVTAIAGGMQHHRASLSALAPGTTYSYRLLHGAEETPGATFTTGPAGAAPFTFTAFGDQGVTAGAVAINNAVAAQSPAFNFHVGDLCYAYNLGTGGFGSVDPTKWTAWLNQIEPVASRTPWMVAVGNHEMEPGTENGVLGYDGVRARLSLPSDGSAGSDVVYAFRYGNVGVVSLDANDISYEITFNNGYSQNRQDAWLDATLASMRADPAIDWIVVGFHHCARCTNVLHGSDGAVRARWEPIFDRHHVDFVVNGHNHSYERSLPLRGGEIVDAGEGTIYLTAGCGGNPRVEVSTAPASYVVEEGGLRVPELTPWSAYRYLDLSFVAFDVDGPSLTLRALRPDGSAIESLTLTK